MIKRVVVGAVTGALGAAVLVVPARAAFVPVPDKPDAGYATNGIVREVILEGHTAYLGGDFTTVTGSNGTFNRTYAAAYDLATGEVTPFNPVLNARVRAIAVRGDSVFLGGDFTQVAGKSRGRLVEVNAATGVPNPAWSISLNGAVRALSVAGDRLTVGGSYGTVAGLAQPRLSAISLTTRTVDTSFRPTVDLAVQALEPDAADGSTFVGGDFTTANGVAVPHLTRLDAAGAIVGAPLANTSGYKVLDLDSNADGSRLFVACGGSGNQAATFDTATGARLWRQRADGDVQAISYEDGNVYFGFHEGMNLDTTAHLRVADAVTGNLEPAFLPVMDSFFGVWALDTSPVGVVSGGEYTTVTGVPAKYFAFFDVHDGPPPPVYTTAIPAGASWRYFDGAAEQSGWRQVAFDDSSWKQGSAQLGYGDGDEATVISYGPKSSTKYPTAYFRRTFTAGPGVDSLVFNLKADDGAVVSVNGQEVVRDNMPVGDITFSTYASSGRSGDAENAVRTFVVPASMLVDGENTVAVEVHQDAPASSDLSFDLNVITVS